MKNRKNRKQKGHTIFALMKLPFQKKISYISKIDSKILGRHPGALPLTLLDVKHCFLSWIPGEVS